MGSRGSVGRRRGFTLVELVFVMVIVGVLALFVIPKFASRVGQSKIATTKANIDSIRTAIELYAADNGGSFPATLGLIVSGGYVRTMPSEAITPSTTVVTTQDNAGGWFYTSSTGAVLPNLSGNDAEGTAYSSY